MIIMYKSIVFICEIANASYLNSEEPCVVNEIQADQCLENFTQVCELQGLHLVQDEKEEEKQLQPQKENEVSFFNWKGLLLGLGVAAVATGIVLHET